MAISVPSASGEDQEVLEDAAPVPGNEGDEDLEEEARTLSFQRFVSASACG
jgi:hypothetical protein